MQTYQNRLSENMYRRHTNRDVYCFGYIYICMFNIANLDACFSMDCFKMLGFTTNKTIFRATGRKRFFVVSDLTHMTSTIPTGRVIITLQPPPSGTHGFNGEPTHLKALEFYEMR